MNDKVTAPRGVCVFIGKYINTTVDPRRHLSTPDMSVVCISKEGYTRYVDGLLTQGYRRADNVYVGTEMFTKPTKLSNHRVMLILEDHAFGK